MMKHKIQESPQRSVLEFLAAMMGRPLPLEHRGKKTKIAQKHLVCAAARRGQSFLKLHWNISCYRGSPADPRTSLPLFFLIPQSVCFPPYSWHWKSRNLFQSQHSPLSTPLSQICMWPGWSTRHTVSSVTAFMMADRKRNQQNTPNFLSLPPLKTLPQEQLPALLFCWASLGWLKQGWFILCLGDMLWSKGHQQTICWVITVLIWLYCSIRPCGWGTNNFGSRLLLKLCLCSWLGAAIQKLSKNRKGGGMGRQQLETACTGSERNNSLS